MRVEPHDGEALDAGCQAPDRADVRAAAAAQHERELGQRRASWRRSARPASSPATTAVSGYGQRERAASAIASPPDAPGARHANQPGGELAPQLWHS